MERTKSPKWVTLMHKSEEKTGEILETENVYVSYAVLAKESPYFFKLFSNGMQESDPNYVTTLKISESEKEVLMEVLRYIYAKKLSENVMSTSTTLLDVLIVADRFEVMSCVRHCTQLLLELPMTLETALLSLEITSSLFMNKEIQPLVNTSKDFIFMHYKDVSTWTDEIYDLSKAGMEAILCRDEFIAKSEDDIYDIVVKWARVHYPEEDERPEILGSCITHLVRFPHMTCEKLRDVLKCEDINRGPALDIVLDALFYKVERSREKHALAAEMSTDRRYTMRAYKSKPVKVIDIQLPKPYCIVYFALENEECASLFPEGSIYSELFYLGGNAFYFRVDCKNFMEAFPHYCNIYLCLELEDAFDPIGVECDYAMRGRAEGRFVKERRVIIPFCSSSGGRIGSHGLYGFEWSSFIEENSTYFVDGMLQLKVELTLNTLQL